MKVSWPQPVRRAGRFVRDRVWRPYFLWWVRGLIGLFPLTRMGVAFLALFAGAAWLYGVLSCDLILLVLGLGGALVMAALLLTTLLAAAITWPRTRKAATPGELDLDTGIPQPTGFRLRAPRFIPFAVVEWKWMNDGGGETEARVELERGGRDLVELASPARRCIVTRIVRRFAVRDLFGLTEISWRRAEKTMLRVMPYRGMLSQMPPPAGLAEGDDLSDPYAEPKGDRVEMRQYAPGDPLRMVLWKVYARSGKMMVRTPERSVAERKRGCAYLVTSPKDDAAAAVARVAIERGLLGEDWCFAADGVQREAVEDRDAAFEIIARSGEASADDRAARLAAFAAKCENEGYQFCLLFIPHDEPAWRAVAEQGVATTSMRVQVITAASEILPDADSSRTRTERAVRWLIKPAAHDGVSMAEIRSRAALIRGLGNDVMLAERNSGRAVNGMLGDRG